MVQSHFWADQLLRSDSASSIPSLGEDNLVTFGSAPHFRR